MADYRDYLRAAVRATKPKMLTAAHESHCRYCDRGIVPGEIIAHSSMPTLRYTVHAGCHAEAWLATEVRHDGAAVG